MKIVSKFTRGIISKALKMVIRKKTGYDIDIQLNEVTTTIVDGKNTSSCRCRCGNRKGRAYKHTEKYWFELTIRVAYGGSFLLLRKIYKAYYERKIVGSVVEQHNYREGRRSESYTVFSFIFF